MGRMGARASDLRQKQSLALNGFDKLTRDLLSKARPTDQREVTTAFIVSISNFLQKISAKCAICVKFHKKSLPKLILCRKNFTE